MEGGYTYKCMILEYKRSDLEITVHGGTSPTACTLRPPSWKDPIDLRLPLSTANANLSRAQTSVAKSMLKSVTLLNHPAATATEAARQARAPRPHPKACVLPPLPGGEHALTRALSVSPSLPITHRPSRTHTNTMKEILNL